MLQDQLLAGLRRTIASGGNEDAAVAGVGTVDPLLRPLARRLLRRALTAELLAAPPEESEAPDVVLRRVYLRLRGGAGPTQVEGEDGVRATYARLSGQDAQRPLRGPWVTGATAALVMLAGLLLAGLGWRHRGGRPGVTPAPPPHPTGAYVRGGRPCAPGPGLRHAFREELAELVIALDRLRDPATRTFDHATQARRLRARRRALLSPRVRDALGPAPFARLGALVEAAEGVARASEALLPLAIRRFLGAVVAMNDALAALNLGVFLDGDVLQGPGERRVVISSFTVEHVLIHRSRHERFRTLLLRRLDRLNLRHNLLGFTRPGQREALVLLGEVESVLVRNFLPGVGSPALPMVDDATRDEGRAWVAAVERRAAAVVRQGLEALPGGRPVDLARLSALLRQRRDLIEWWRALLAHRGITVEEPDRLAMGAQDRALLARLVPGPELTLLDRLQRRLLAGDAPERLAQLALALGATVARHEVQHRLDYHREAHWEVPAPLRRLVGPARDRRGRPRPFARRATHELSATLAEIAREPHAPHLSLTLAARTLLDRDFHNRLEVASARVVLEGLDGLLFSGRPGGRVSAPGAPGGAVAEEDGLLQPEPRPRGHDDREALAARYLRLSHVSPALLRRAAARLWRRFFGAPLPTLTSSPAPRPGTEPWVCPEVGWDLPAEADGPPPGPRDARWGGLRAGGETGAAAP